MEYKELFCFGFHGVEHEIDGLVVVSSPFSELSNFTLIWFSFFSSNVLIELFFCVE
jgi:hypothetical protein